MKPAAKHTNSCPLGASSFSRYCNILRHMILITESLFNIFPSHIVLTHVYGIRSVYDDMGAMVFTNLESTQVCGDSNQAVMALLGLAGATELLTFTVPRSSIDEVDMKPKNSSTFSVIGPGTELAGALKWSPRAVRN